MLPGMRVPAALLILFQIAPPLPAAEVYRYVDPERGVEYSDTPRPGAERILIPETPVAPVIRTPPPSALAPEAAETPAGTALAYVDIAIVDPADQDTLRDNAGNLIVAVSLDPPLQADFGHRLRLLLDGAVAGEGVGTHFALSELDRGTHTLQAVVVGSDGQALVSSAVTTFHLHRMTVQQIQRRKAAENPAPATPP